MTLLRSGSEVLKGHVTLEVEGIDRMYLNVYVPQLQREQGVLNFLRYHRGQPFASSALLAPISDAFIRSTETLVDAQDIPHADLRQGSAQG
jgi:hypothetical protein